MELKWYRFNQNNSGGSFHYDEAKGLGYTVYIQANNYVEANSILESIGGYFDPDCEIDCECCGPRWFSIDDESSYNIVEDSKIPAKDEKFTKTPPWKIKWMGEGKAETFVHPYNGEHYGTYRFSE